MLAAVLAGGAHAGEAASAFPAVHVFDIPSKPLLAALADFSAATGVQVIRPGAQKLAGRAPAVSGRQDAETALKALLAGSGLRFRAVGPRTVALENALEIQPVQLEGEATYLEQIDVTGKGTGGRRSEGGDGKIDITAEDIERKQPQDIKQVFQGEPGIQVGGSNPINQKVYVHGVEENNLAVSIDGAAQNNKVFHHNATTVIDPALLKTARVDAGVAPADAGFGALAGSIAYETKDVADLLGETAAPSPIVSKDPLAPAEPKWFGGFAKTAYNTNGDIWTNNFALYGKKDGFEALGFFNIARGGSYDRGSKYIGAPGLNTGRKVDGTSTHLTSGLAKFAFEGDGGDRFEFSHERVVDDADRPYRANAGAISIPGRREPMVRSYELKRQNSVFTYTDTNPEGWWDPKVVFAYSKTEVRIPIFAPVAVVDGVRIFGYDRDALGETATYTGRAENKFSFENGNVVAGVDFRRDRAKLDYDPVDPLGEQPSRERSTVAGVYAQARLEPIERTRISFGGRGDYQWFKGVNDTPGAKKNHGGFSGNASGEYDLIEDLLTAKAGYSHVWAGVPLAENFIFNKNWRYYAAPHLGLDDLKATTSDNVNAGLVLKHSGFTVEGSVFRTAIDHARLAAYSTFDATSVPPSTPWGASRTRDLVSKGFELGAGYAWESGFVKVKWAHIKVNIDGKRADSDTGVYLTTPVGNIISLAAAHTFAPYNVTVGADAEIAPQYNRTVGVDAVTGKRIPYRAYDVYNAFVEYKPKFAQFDTTFRVDVKNILNKTYSSRATYGSEFGTVTPLFEPGRSVILSAAVKF